ncbi:hypothetical protein P0D72_14760, partial [Paraburkholderia sediminicola]|uniref:hypothetical protein n=1 Tax=Paraburkholderia sediminicola TaxID=458836 RepID=UPI0038BD5A48
MLCASVLIVIMVLLANYGRYGRISNASDINDGPAGAAQAPVSHHARMQRRFRAARIDIAGQVNRRAIGSKRIPGG